MKYRFYSILLEMVSNDKTSYNFITNSVGVIKEFNIN